ncbi:DUF262 domain-containing protein [Alteromonas sp. OM2203]|uniref:DUF262 domain-containing protein n=1 Tax=Alteromonas sp. OM2203 TaxID=3398817 RepID=UPI003AF36530
MKKSLKVNLETLQQKAKERTVRTQTVEYDLETIVKKVDKQVIKLNPEYQRRHRWDIPTASRLIESLILNIPVPFIYISQDVDVDDEVEEGIARYSVIDGQQRLTAIFNFFKNDFALQDLEVLETLNGCRYADLPSFLVRRLEERSIKCLRIDSTLDQQVKYDIFERLNSGSVKLEPQELRNATCRGPFKDLSLKLAKLKPFREMSNLTEDSKRLKKMEDVELVLRYFAINYQDGYLQYKGGFKKFLTQKMVEFNSLDSAALLDFETDFVAIISYLKQQNIAHPFAKYRVDKNDTLEQMSTFNVAVFDAAIAFYRESLKRGGANKEFTEIFRDPEFFAAVEGSTNDVKKLVTRVSKAIELARK